MKVKSIKINNFKGIENKTFNFDNPVTVISGKVGTGKTSMLEALRFALTNEIPTNPIKMGKLEASVSVTAENSETAEKTEITRILSKTGKSVTKSVMLMGRKTTGAKADEFISETSQVDSSIMKLATSTEALTSLKPDSFGGLFLNESLEERTIGDLINVVESLEMKEKNAAYVAIGADVDDPELPKIIEREYYKLFPENKVNIESIKKAFDKAKDNRKEAYTMTKSAGLRSEGFEKLPKPEFNMTELQKRYDEIVGVERSVISAKNEIKAYQAAKKAFNDQQKRIFDLSLMKAANTSVKPDTNVLNDINNKLSSLDKEKLDKYSVSKSLRDFINKLNDTLNKLDKPVCPISNKLICKTDKTGVKTDLITSLEAAKKSLEITEEDIQKVINKMKDLESQKQEYFKNIENWTKKQNIEKEIENIKTHPVIVPEEPESLVIETVDYEAEKKRLKEKMSEVMDYNNMEKEYRIKISSNRDLKIHDFIMKTLDPKGPAVQKFIETFLECLEDACNERAMILNPDFKIKLIPEDGIKVLFKVKSDRPFLLYQNLSAGEKIFAELILTDLINSFYNSRILILDDTDHLDAKAFESLMNFITESSITDLYDNIFISCVEHDDTLNIVKKYKEVNSLKMED